MTFIKFGGVIDEEKEEKYKKINIKRKVKKTVFNIFKYVAMITLLCVVFLGLVELDSVICQEINKLNLPYNNNYFDICNTMFGIQSTITTLTIALTSFFSGIIKEKIYGMYITEYIIKVKSKRFNMYNLSIVLFILSILYFGFLAECAYIMCCCIFVISTIIIMHIMKVVYRTVMNYDSISQDIENYIKEIVIHKVFKIKYDGDENSIRYILEDDADIKDLYSKSEKILNNLYNDTVEKINIDDYNSYSQNVKIIEKIFYQYNCDNMGIIQKDIFETIMQRYYDLIDIFINKKKCQIAIEMLEYISDKIQFGIQHSSMSIEGKKDYIYFLNIDEYILRLCGCIEMQYSYSTKLTQLITRLIKNKQFYYLVYMDVNMSKEEYDCDYIYNSISKLLGTYILCIKNNKYWTNKEKEKGLEFVNEYNNTYRQNGSSWGQFLDYYSYLFVTTDENNELVEKVNKENPLYIAMKEEVEKIKRKLNIFIEEIINGNYRSNK